MNKASYKMRSFNPVFTRALGTGSGGGSFFGTQTPTTMELSTVLGFYLVAPLFYLRNATSSPALNTVLQVTSQAAVYNLEEPDIAFNYGRKTGVSFSNLYASNLQPNSGPLLWSTVTVFTSPTQFEVFALIWTLAASYQFVGALSSFVVSNGIIASAGPTTLRLTVTSTEPLPLPLDAATPSPGPFLSMAAISSGTLDSSERSNLLQSWVLGILTTV